MATKKKVIQGGLDVQKSDGTSALTVDETSGAVTVGPSGVSSTLQHTIYGYSSTAIALKIFNKQSTTQGTITINGSDGTNYVEIGVLGAGAGGGQAYFKGISGNTASSGATVYVTSGNLLGTSTSVREAKTNIQPLGSTLGWLKQLKPYVYQYRKQVDGIYTDEAEDFVNTGLIYDEVVQVNPQLCFDTADGKPSGVEYTRLITPMLKAIQELSAKLDEANAKIAALEAK